MQVAVEVVAPDTVFLQSSSMLKITLSSNSVDDFVFAPLGFIEELAAQAMGRIRRRQLADMTVSAFGSMTRVPVDTGINTGIKLTGCMISEPRSMCHWSF